MTPDQVRNIIKEELAGLIRSDRYTFQKDLEIFDSRSIKVGAVKGTQIGTTATQKLALWGKTPIVQPASHAGLLGADGVDFYFYGTGSVYLVTDTTAFYGNSGTKYTIGDIVKNLKDAGILAQ